MLNMQQEANKNPKIDDVAVNGAGGKSSKIIGIDFGSKRIGLSISDESLSFAFPLMTIAGFGHDKDKKTEREENTKKELLSIFKDRGITKAIIGHSFNLKGEDNEIMKDARILGDFLTDNGIEVVYEQEIFSTVSATKFQGETDHVDASAAAIILQSYLDRVKFRNN